MRSRPGRPTGGPSSQLPRSIGGAGRPAPIDLWRSTGISWTQATWNPFVGCSIHTAGCTNCYAMAIAHRLEGFGQASYQGTARLVNGKPVWTGRVNRATDATMRKPFTIREPSLVFVNSMSDFWHPAAEDSWRLEALAVMSSTPHQYQVLTKRPEEIAPFLERTGAQLPANFWAGVTVERADFKHRIDTLRAVPANIRFLSLEPLLGALPDLSLKGIHWVIAGGESGSGARPMAADWVRNIRDQCVAQRVAFYMKQYGIPSNNPLYSQGGAAAVARLDPGEKGGSLIDGRHWHEWPDFNPRSC